MTTRNIRPFVHLRVLSSYSLGLGLSSPGEICRHARRVGFDTVALTDVSGTFGFAELHHAAREVGVKPIYGTLLYLDWENPPGPDDPVQSVVLLALDRAGLRNVCALATVSATRRERGEGLYAEDLDGRGDGLVAIAGLDLTRTPAETRHALSSLREIFSDLLFVECRDGLSQADAAAQQALAAAAKGAGIAPVLVQDVRFVGPARLQLADLMTSGEEASYAHRVFGDARAGDAGPGHGMRTAAEMSGAFEAMPEAHANAASIAALAQPDLFESVEQTPEPSGTITMFAGSPGGDSVLRARVDAVLRARDGDGAGDMHAVVDRELRRIERLGIADRFVQYEEIVRRLRNTGVNIGPATGLTLQSRCAWLLGITAFDPYALDDRFDPEFEARAGATRILDLQIAPEERPRVLATLNQVYDDASIGYVPSVEHVTAARALRIAARRAEFPTGELEEALRIAARFPGTSLRELSEDSRSLGRLYRRSAAFRDLVAHAASIEGLPFGFVRSKRTIAVSRRSLRAMFAYMVNPETGDHFIQSTRDSFPLGGIRRIDIDALHALAWVGRDGAWGTAESEPYRLVSGGDLEGIHLLEGRAGALAAQFAVASFEDLVLFVALLRHRGGGSGMAERVAAFRGDRAAVPAGALVDDILAPSNGWVLFRDQARDVVARLTHAGREDASAMLTRFEDHSPGNLAALRREFLARTVEVPVPLEDASAWFARLLRLAERAQERQRVLAECLIIHRSLVLKHADRIRFLAHVLDHTPGGDKRRRYRDSLESERKWLPADVNRSGRRHQVEGGCIRAPLWDANGVTREAADTIIRMRGSGRYTSVDEFRCAAGDAGINLDVVDALVRVGAFDSVEEREAADGNKEPRRGLPQPAISAQLGMDFDASQTSNIPHAYAPSDRPPIKKDGNQRSSFRVVPSLMEFYPHPSATPVELAGRIRNLHDYRTSSGKTVGFFELFDSSGSVRVFVPWERVVHTGEPLNDGSHAIVKGKVRLRDGRKVCDAMEIVVAEGGNGHGETPPDKPSKGDS